MLTVSCFNVVVEELVPPRQRLRLAPPCQFRHLPAEFARIKIRIDRRELVPYGTGLARHKRRFAVVQRIIDDCSNVRAAPLPHAFAYSTWNPGCWHARRVERLG